MKATIENINHLTRDEQSAVKVIASTINSKQDFEWIQLLNPFFIYRGGNHIAVHQSSGDSRRILLVTF
jgi:hypothetical protein